MTETRRRSPARLTRAQTASAARHHVARRTAGRWHHEVLTLAQGRIVVVIFAPQVGELWLHNIEAVDAGQHLADAVLGALRGFCDERAVTLFVGPITSRGYWEGRHDWLATAPFDDHGDPVLVYRPPGDRVVAWLPRRTAHATHALLQSSRVADMPVTAAEVTLYDEEALSPRCTGAALKHARRLGLAHYTGRYWIPSIRALELRTVLEDRYLRETDH